MPFGVNVFYKLRKYNFFVSPRLFAQKHSQTFPMLPKISSTRKERPFSWMQIVKFGYIALTTANIKEPIFAWKQFSNKSSESRNVQNPLAPFIL